MSSESLDVYNGVGDFGFTAIDIDELDAMSYTLVTIAVDTTGSVGHFRNDLLEMLKTSVKACKDDPRSNNLLVRVIEFNSSLPSGFREIHGFMPVEDINVDGYQPFSIRGMTPLCDAAYSAVTSTRDYGYRLNEEENDVNAIVIIITDGDDNASSTTPKMVKSEIVKIGQEEKLESLLTILVGINAAQYEQALLQFQADAGINEYRASEDVTKNGMMKLAGFISQSISSQSQALGSGGPSQSIAASI